MKVPGLLLLLLLPFAADAGSIYLCRAYSGGTFWSPTHCNQHSALIERIASVPDGLPWDQQVMLGEQQRAGGGSSRVHQGGSSGSANHHASRQAECKALGTRISNLDSMARQPQSGRTQDRLRDQSKESRDRQFALRCQ